MDSSGNAYVVGNTRSTDFPTASAINEIHSGGIDAGFVTKINSLGSALAYSTFLGGTGRDNPKAVVVDSSGNAYVAGWTGSTDFPTSSPYQASYGGGTSDAFIAKIGPSNGPSLSYSSETGYSSTDGVDPEAGTNSTSFTYLTLYTSADDTAPITMEVCIDSSCSSMFLDTGAAATLRDGDYTNGEQYYLTTTLADGSHDYYFSASDGVDIVRLPASETISAPSVAPISILTSSFSNGNQGVSYIRTLSATGGTTPYTWSLASGSLSTGLSLNSSTGVVSGIPTTTGTSAFTIRVTDDNFDVATKILSITIDISDVDLAVSGLSASSSVTANTNISINSSVTNQGSDDASTFFTFYYVSNDTTLSSGDRFIGYSSSWYGLNAGATTNRTLSLKWPYNLTSGTYYILAQRIEQIT